jgi:hypothetical protein
MLKEEESKYLLPDIFELPVTIFNFGVIIVFQLVATSDNNPLIYSYPLRPKDTRQF